MTREGRQGRQRKGGGHEKKEGEREKKNIYSLPFVSSQNMPGISVAVREGREVGREGN